MDDLHRQGSGGAPGPPAAVAMPLVALEPARAASNTAAVRSASGEALAAMQRRTVVIKTLAVGALAAGAGALIDHLPDEVLAVVLCSVASLAIAASKEVNSWRNSATEAFNCSASPVSRTSLLVIPTWI